MRSILDSQISIASSLAGDDVAQTSQLKAALAAKLALIDWAPRLPFPWGSDTLIASADLTADEVGRVFHEYFDIDQVSIQEAATPPVGLGKLFARTLPTNAPLSADGFPLPTDWCGPVQFLKLKGRRGWELPPPFSSGAACLQGLFVADLLWLYFHEEMGLFRLSGAILDDYALRGCHEIENDTWSAYVLETLARLTGMGLASRRRDRSSVYERCLGFPAGGATEGVVVNGGFREQFERLVSNALRFYRERNVTETIKNQATISSPSTATVTALRNGIVELRNSMRPFEFGRCASITLEGIVHVTAAMALLRDLRATVGGTAQANKPENYVPMLYEKLVLAPQGLRETMRANRYLAHKTCAEAGRAILLGLPFLEDDDRVVRLWLGAMEPFFENYRKSFVDITGRDLAAVSVAA